MQRTTGFLALATLMACGCSPLAALDFPAPHFPIPPNPGPGVWAYEFTTTSAGTDLLILENATATSAEMVFIDLGLPAAPAATSAAGSSAIVACAVPAMAVGVVVTVGCVIYYGVAANQNGMGVGTFLYETVTNYPHFFTGNLWPFG